MRMKKPVNFKAWYTGQLLLHSQEVQYQLWPKAKEEKKWEVEASSEQDLHIFTHNSLEHKNICWAGGGTVILGP